ncbi:GWxTD domain-containing protein [candidate division KSB1 bacterium]
MKNFTIKLLIISLLFSMTVTIFSQEDKQPFNVMLFEHPSENEGCSSLSIYIMEFFNNLEFFKNDSVFESKYEFSVELYDEDLKLIESKYWEENVVVKSYEETGSREKFINEYIYFELKPSKYDFILEVKNKDSGKLIQKREKIKVQDYWDKEYTITEIVAFEGKSLSEDEFRFFKDLKEIKVDFEKGLTLYAEIFSNKISQSSIIEWKISSIYKPDETLFSHYDSVNIEQNKIIPVKVFLSGYEIESGSYKLELLHDDIKLEKTVNLLWVNFPVDAVRLPEGIEYMKYILKSDEKKALLELPEDRQRLEFLEYWKNMEPEEDKNFDLMKEYFYRISYANMKFSTAFERGWESDMGETYVKLGRPDKISTRDEGIAIGEKYQIWDYRELSRRYVFIDRYKNGEYKLVKIITPQGEINF